MGPFERELHLWDWCLKSIFLLAFRNAGSAHLSFHSDPTLSFFFFFLIGLILLYSVMIAFIALGAGDLGQDSLISRFFLLDWLIAQRKGDSASHKRPKSSSKKPTFDSWKRTGSSCGYKKAHRKKDGSPEKDTSVNPNKFIESKGRKMDLYHPHTGARRFHWNWLCCDSGSMW